MVQSDSFNHQGINRWFSLTAFRRSAQISVPKAAQISG